MHLLQFNDSLARFEPGDVIPSNRETALFSALAAIAGTDRANALLRRLGANGLEHMDAQEIAATGGITLELAESIVAARRFGGAFRDEPLVSAGCPELLLSALPVGFARLEREMLLAVAMTGRHTVKAVMVVSVGGISGTCLLPRDVFVPVLRLGATAFAISHNHPSGDPTPSRDDVAMTNAVARGAELLGLQLVDHLVVATGGVVSFASTGLLPTSRELAN
jgi:DNA repair protein RadC